MLFTYDATLASHKKITMQCLTALRTRSQTEEQVLHQPGHEAYHPPQIYVDKTKLKAAHQFTYLRHIISSNA